MRRKFFSRKWRGDIIFDLINVTLLALISFCFLFPLFIVLMQSFVSEEEYVSRAGQFILIPQTFDLGAYELLLTKGSSILHAYWITIKRVVLGVIVQLFFTCTMAYGLSKNSLPGRKFIIGLINVAIVMPAPLVPLFLLVRFTGLYDNFWSMIIPFAINSVYIFIMKAFYQQLPDGIEEAAVIDGCNQVQLFTKIVLPLSLPSITTVGMMYGVWHWNEWYYSGLFIRTASERPLQNIMQGIINSASATDLAIVAESLPPVNTLRCAVIMISIIPIICIYPFLQKYFAKGFLVGSVKG